MVYCTCVANPVELIGNFESAHLTTGGYTQFFLFRCESCKRLGGFPRVNFELALNQGDEEVQQILEKYDKVEV